MTMQYAKHVSKKTTPQSEPAREDQKKNNAGGYTFVVDCWSRLERFLILGSEGGTYYVGEGKLTRDNAKCVEECLKLDAAKAIAKIVEISDEGRAPSNDPAIFALALAAANENRDTRRLALAALPKVCRIGTHLFHFVATVKELRGWGRGLREAIARWYTDRPADRLAHMVLKYQSRDGWSNKDILQMVGASATPPTDAHKAVFRWISTGKLDMGPRVVTRKTPSGPITREYPAIPVEAVPSLLTAYEELKGLKDPKDIARMVTKHGFTHEMVPTESKNSPDVWSALLPSMPVGAMVRNLGKMTQVGILEPLSVGAKKVTETLSDESALKKARLHPLAILTALLVYKTGHGALGKLTWTPNPRVVDALDAAFYLAFKTIVPTGKNLLLAIDISGSMGMGTIHGGYQNGDKTKPRDGLPGLTPRHAAAVMAMVTARVEKNWHMIGFTSGGVTRERDFPDITQIPITPTMGLDAAMAVMDRMPMGSTDCSLPMRYALARKMPIDGFFVYTDNETFAGSEHPHQSLEKYRRGMGRPAKMVVTAFTATEFTIADPKDPGMMDVVGFDTNSPAVLADFVRS